MPKNATPARSSATSTAAETATSAWQARPWLARSIRAFAFLTPVVVSAVAVYILDQRFRPAGFVLRILWIALLVAFAIGISRVLVSGTQRLLPVAMLYRMSLVFPDNAPSRFGLAMRGTSMAELKRQLATDDLSQPQACLLYTSPSPRDATLSRMPSSA